MNLISKAALAVLFAFLPLPAIGAAASVSGVYGELTVGFDSQTQTVTGYYVNGTGSNPSGNGPQFSCIFYLSGKKTGAAVAIQTWFPGDPKNTKIAGELQWVPASGGKAAGLSLKLKEEPGGCGMVDPDLASPQGSQLSQDASGAWIEVRVVSAARAHFYDSPEAAAPRKTYVVKGDGLRVWEKKPGWVLADYEGRNKGWIQEKDLFPDHP